MTDNPILGERFNDALVYAATLHRCQLRKDTTIPYVSHLLAVTSIVLEHGGDEDEAIGALLHDAVEDSGIEELPRIKEKFGAAVADIVVGCSDSLLPRGQEKEGWALRKQRYIEHVAQASPSVRLVSAADKLHNARSILTDYRREGEKLWGRFNAGAVDQRWYYRALVSAFRNATPAPTDEHARLIGELALVVAELERAMTERGYPPAASESARSSSGIGR